MTAFRKWLAEAVGTFALVFAGTGAIVSNELHGGALGHVGVSITFGLVVMAMIYAVGNVSGAHLNPAVTLGFVVARRMKLKDGIPFILAQLVGALMGSLLVRLIWGWASGTSLGVTLPAGDAVAAAFGLEVALTFLLMFVILNVSTGAMEKGIMAGAAIGATVGLCALFGGPVSGASMNPARSLAPAVVGANFRHIWLYLVAPALGAALAGPTCLLIQGPECCEVREQALGEADR